MNSLIHTTQDTLASPNGPSSDTSPRTPSLDALATSLGKARAQAVSAAQEVAEGAGHAAHDSLEAMRQQIARAGDRGTDYVRGHPLQSVLIAAGAGAAIALLMRALWRSH